MSLLWLRRTLAGVGLAVLTLGGADYAAGLPETSPGMPVDAHGLPMTADDSRWVWPLDPLPGVVRLFLPPASPWGPGHRGVDLAARTHQVVLSIGAGEVTFAAPLAGRGVVVVTHGALRSTYEPVTASVTVGEHVAAGDPVGLMQPAPSHCAPAVCLHLGVRRGEVYVDPLSLLGRRPVRLKPLGSMPPGGAPPGWQPAVVGSASTGSLTSTADPHPAGRERSGTAIAGGVAVGAVVGGIGAVGVGLLAGGLRRQARRRIARLTP